MTADNNSECTQLREGKLHQKQLKNAINLNYKVLFGASILSMMIAMILLFTIKSIYGAGFFMTLSIMAFFRLVVKSVLYRQRDIDLTSGVYCIFEYDENAIILFSKSKYRREIPLSHLYSLDFTVNSTGSVHAIVLVFGVTGKDSSKSRWMFPVEESTYYELFSFLKSELKRGNPNLTYMKLDIDD